MSRCETKMSFGSSDDAKRMIRDQKRSKGRQNALFENRKLSPYLCPECGLYHLTSKSNKEQRAIRKLIRERVSDE